MPPGPPPRDGGGVAPHHPEAPSSPTAASEIELQVPGPSRVSTALSELSPPGTVRGQPDRENEGTWKPRRPSLNMLRSGLGRLQTKDGSQKIDKEVEKVNEDEQGQHQTLPQQDKDQTTMHCKLTVLSTVLPPLLPAVDVVAIHDIDQSPEAAWAYTPHPVFQKGAIDPHMQPVNEEDDELAEDKPDADVYLSFSNAPGGRRKSSLLPGSLNVWTEEEGYAHGHPRDIKEWAFQVPTILQGDVTPSTDPRGAFRDGSGKEKEKMTETIEQLQGDLSPRASMVEQDGRPGHLDANPSASHSGIRTPSETEHKTSRWLTDPTMFAGDFSRSRIMRFSYKSAEMPAHLGSSAMPDFDQYLEETAQSLLDNLLAGFVEENEGAYQARIPLVLIGVGFGCLIIQKLVSLAATHDMLNMVAGVFFFDVPTPIIAEESADIFPPSPNTNSRWFKSMTGSVPRLIDCGELWQSFRSVAAKQDLSVCWFYRVTANKPIYPQADGVIFEPLIAYPAKSTRTHGRFLGPKDPNYIRFAERTRASLLFKVASDRELEHLLVDLINTSLDGMHTVLMRDCKGRCALHRAASRGNDLAVTRLVSAFPKLAALRDDDGRTALHSVILRAIEVNPEEENQEQYKSIIEKLLSTMIELEEPGQLDDPKDHDSKSPWDYVQEDRHQWIRSLRDRSILFKGARSEHGERLGTITQPVAEKLAVCRKSEAFFFQFYIAKNNSRDWFDRAPSNIYRLLYDPNYGAENIFLRNKRIDPEKKATCRWIHLPANNEEWIQDLFTQLRRVDSSMRGKRHEGTNYYDRYLNPGAERYQQTYEPESGGTNEPPLPTSPMSPMPSTPRTPSFQSNPLTSPTGQRSPKLGEDLRSGHYRSYSGTFPQPSSTSSTDVGSVKKAAIALFMPILGFEEHENRIKLRSAMMTACKESAKRDAMMTPSGGSVKNEAMTPSRALVKDETSMLIRSYFGAKDSPLHCRRTLDQFTYHMLEDTVKRDNTQVIFKWAAKQGEKRTKNPAKQKGLESDRPPQNQDSSQVGHTYPVLMVDQLWLWVLEDDETVITSFSNTWKPNAEFSLFQYLQQDLQNNHSRPLVESGFDLANLIIKSSVDFLRRQGPEKMSLQEGFQASINDIAENQARLFDDFKKLVDKLNDDRLSQKKRARYTNRLFQLTEETDFLADIMDIQDELKTIKDVFLKQKEVLGQFVQLFSKGQQKKSKGQKEKKKGKEHQRKASAELDASAQKQQSPKASRIRELAENNLNSVNANITAVEEMTKYADKIRAELNTLLNLKQKQANVWEARFSREGSEQTQRQGNITMVFTIVTIFFLPLSFMSSFLAIQVDTFPKNAETGEVSWPARQAMVLLFGLSLAIIVPFTLVAFHVNQISAFVGKYVKIMRQSRAPDLPTHKTPEKPLVHDYADPGNDSDSSTGEGSNQSPPWGRKKRKFKHTLPAWRRILPLPGLVRTPSKDGTSWSSSGSSTSIVSRRLFPRHHLYAPLFGRQGWYFHTRIPWVRRWWKFRYYSESLFSTATASSGSSNPMKLEGSSSSSSVSSDSASARRQRWNDRVVRDYPLRRAMERVRKVMEQPLASWRKKNKQKDDDDRSEESGSGVERDLIWLANNAENIARQPAGQLGQQPYSYGTSKGWAAFQPMKKAFTFRKPVAVPRVDLDVDLEKGRPWV